MLFLGGPTLNKKIITRRKKNTKNRSYLLNTLQVELLTLLSLRYLLLSSKISLMAVTPNTNITGIIEISLPKALIAGTQLSRTINKK